MRGLIVILLVVTGILGGDALKGNRAYGDGDYARAEEAYRKAMTRAADLSPDHRFALEHNLAAALYRSGEYEDARIGFERAANLAPDRPERARAAYNAGTAAMAAGSYAEAADLLDIPVGTVMSRLHRGRKQLQRALYDVVLAAQRAAIAEVKPGALFHSTHDTAVRVLTEGLVDLGLLPRGVEESLAMHHYRQYYFHGTGHWLGLDVHDVGDYKVGDEWRVLEPGMVMTVEPGIYIPAGTRGVPKRYWNCGIRIEDDVVVTANGCEVLTAGVPGDPDEVEALVGAG